jgi:hypothetical protein
MTILHLLRSDPDDLTRAFIDEVSENKESKEICLYREPVDYDNLIQDIFESDQMISWW